MPRRKPRKEVRIAPNFYQPTVDQVKKVEPPLTHSDGSPATLEQIGKALIQPVTLLPIENPKYKDHPVTVTRRP